MCACWANSRNPSGSSCLRPEACNMRHNATTPSRLKLDDFQRAYEELHELFAKSKPTYEELRNFIVDILTGG